MIFFVYVPLLASVLLAVISRPLVSRLPPRAAARALVGASGLSAAASTWGLLLLALTLLREAPPVAERAAPAALAADQPVPVLVAAAATAALSIGVYRLVVAVHSRRGTQHALQALCDRTAAHELVVVAAAEPHALAVPGRTGWWWSGRPTSPGRILVTSGMLAALDGDERRVLLEHERAHLRLRHSWQQALVDTAAAVNPLLRPARDSVAFLLERCADEAAADAVGDRPLTARSLARAALAGTATPQDSVLAFHKLGVPARVAALAVAPPPARRALAGAVVAVGLLTTLAAADATVAFVALVHQLLPTGV